MKHAFVTGADRGLGFDLTLELLERGYTVFAGRYMPDWEALDGVPEGRRDRLHVLELDVSDPASVEKAAAAVSGKTDSLDLIVNNAGISGDKEGSIFGDISYEHLNRMYAVNAVGPLRIVQALSGLLLKGADKLVVNISSEAGQINQAWREGWYGYCMSKAALNIQSNIVHNELKGHGGKVLVLHPGWMKSYMGGVLGTEGDLTTAEAAEQIAGTIQRYLEDREERKHPDFRDYAGREMSWT
ncbi:MULTISPECIES: SDR family oxidoreductase [Paenibacillus]|uniref:Predicted protein n=1 Tax=Physcomitrium patens TaxID=3218 RepID=A9U7F9_PHYPA|nr:MULTISPECIES: SDR family oxidoreductase [Paenibacillus]KKC49129.1 hypothetical protein VE23_21870 [Paenibacillus sp. D9]